MATGGLIGKGHLTAHLHEVVIWVTIKLLKDFLLYFSKKHSIYIFWVSSSTIGNNHRLEMTARFEPNHTLFQLELESKYLILIWTGTIKVPVQHFKKLGMNRRFLLSLELSVHTLNNIFNIYIYILAWTIAESGDRPTDHLWLPKPNGCRLAKKNYFYFL